MNPIFPADLELDARVSNLEKYETPSEGPHQTDPGLRGNVGPAPKATDDGTEPIDGMGPGRTESAPFNTSRPVDIAHATFGPPPPQAEAIIGEDERKKIADPAKPPWCMNASLQIMGPDGQTYLGTGWFVSPRTLVTAGHCVFVHDRDGKYQNWVRAIRVMPGRNGSEMPFTPVVSNEFHSVAGWTRDKNPLYDYAAIVIPTPLGSSTGGYGIGVFDDRGLIGRQANIAGYPADKVGPDDGTQWYDARKIQSVEARQMHYEIDTYGGQSGSCVWIIENEERLAVGIHTYGDSYFGNSATRIDLAVRANINAWKK